MAARKAAIIGCLQSVGSGVPGYKGGVSQVSWNATWPTKATTTTTAQVTLPAATIPVASTTGFSTTSGPNPGNNGVILVYTQYGPQYVSFTSTDGTDFLGCSGGIGTVLNGATVIGGGFDWTLIENAKTNSIANFGSAVPLRIRFLGGAGLSARQVPTWVDADVGTLTFFDNQSGNATFVPMPCEWKSLYGDYFGCWMAAAAFAYDTDTRIAEIVAPIVNSIFCEPFQYTAPPQNADQLYNGGALIAAGFTDAQYRSELSRRMGMLTAWQLTNVIVTFHKYHQVDPAARNDTGCNTSGVGSTVTDAAIQSTDAGRGVSGAGIPLGATVGTVTPGVSFTLGSGAVLTGNGTASSTICIGSNTDLDDERQYMGPVAAQGWSAGRGCLRGSAGQWAQFTNTAYNANTPASDPLHAGMLANGGPITGQTLNALGGQNPDAIIAAAIACGLQSLEIGAAMVAILGQNGGTGTIASYNSQLSANAKTVR